MRTEGFTSHAQTRLQQRGIPPLIVNYLEQFGTFIRCDGADRAIFDKAALERLRKHLGGRRGMEQFGRWVDVYAVFSESGEVIIVAHQTQRHHRN